MKEHPSTNYVRRGWRAAQDRDDTPAGHVYTFPTAEAAELCELPVARFLKMARSAKIKSAKGRGKKREWDCHAINAVNELRKTLPGFEPVRVWPKDRAEYTTSNKRKTPCSK